MVALNTTPRFVVRQNVCQAPSGRGGKFRRPVVVRVLDTSAGPGQWHWVRFGSVEEWRNVDSRYSGYRSEYGQALADARALCDRLNAEQPAELAVA